MSKRNYLILPENQSITDTAYPKFRWDEYPNAKSYTLNINKLVNWDYVPFLKFEGITRPEFDECSFTPPTPLDENGIYSWNITAVLNDGTEEVIGTYYLAGPFNYKTHPANVGVDFSFDGPPSQDVINNYLSRGVNCMLLDESLGGGLLRFEENLRMLLYTGAKYIQRAVCSDCWDLRPEKSEVYPRVKACIDKAHRYDPEIIFEGGVYEIVNEEVNRTKIPAFVFEAFGLPYEDRNFILDRMIYEDGRFFNFDTKTGNPDISQLETQMWFYYRGTLHIDMGCECVHLGSTPCMSEIDALENGCKGWKRITDLLHEYGRKHARRGWVLLNGHAFNMVTDNNELVFDFNAWLIHPYIPEGQEPGLPTDDHPQKIELAPDVNPVALYGKTVGGKHPCGYDVERTCYVVEFDNYGNDWSIANTPNISMYGTYPWGFEDIGWLCRQPTEYRRYFLDYAFNRVKEMDGDYGHITLPLLRAGCYIYLHANLPEFGYNAATGDEVAVRNVFVKDNK